MQSQPPHDNQIYFVLKLVDPEAHDEEFVTWTDISERYQSHDGRSDRDYEIPGYCLSQGYLWVDKEGKTWLTQDGKQKLQELSMAD